LNQVDDEETQEPSLEAEQEINEEETAELAPETPEPSPREPSNELKVIIVMKADKLMLGVQSPDCDPVYTTMQGSLSMALKKVPALVAEAKLKWETNPRYPKADLPQPPPRPTPARTPAAPKPAARTNQPSFF